jgi:hypothetical protein
MYGTDTTHRLGLMTRATDPIFSQLLKPDEQQTQTWRSRKRLLPEAGCKMLAR